MSRRSPAEVAERARQEHARTLVVSCPNWPVIARGGSSSGLLAVAERSRIVAVSPAAEERGVRVGQHQRQAQSHCPALEVHPRNRGAELRAFEPIVATLETFGAPVALREAGWAALRTRGPARYFGGELAFARAVAAALGTAPPLAPPAEGAPPAPDRNPPAPDEAPLIGSYWRIGLADGPFAATIAARLGVIVASAETRSFLAGFPVEVLEQPELTDVLIRLGITTLGAFAALGEPDVSARFGLGAGRAHELASGREHQALITRRPPQDFVAAVTLEPPAERIDAATFAARRLAESLCARLEALGLACGQLSVSVVTSEGERRSRRWSHDGRWTPALIVERLRWQLEAWLGERVDPAGEAFGLGGGVEHIELTAEEVIPDDGRQLTLWSRPYARDDQAARAFARVQGILGPDAVQRVILGGGRGPAERPHRYPFGDPEPTDTARSARLPWPGQLPAPNPTVVFDTPLPIEVLDGGGATVTVDARGTVSAVPAVLVDGPLRAAVTAWAGPWPVDERWWVGAARRRRARFQVLTEFGEAYLVAVEKGRWIAEGRYD